MRQHVGHIENVLKYAAYKRDESCIRPTSAWRQLNRKLVHWDAGSLSLANVSKLKFHGSSFIVAFSS